MRTIKQLLRQPIKTIFGLLLMTLAAAIVCVCVGQSVAAKTTKEELNRRFSAVAIPLVKEPTSEEETVTNDSFFMESDLIQWIERMALEHPDIVKGFARSGMLSAYIPELTPFNVTEETYQVFQVYTNTVNNDYYSNFQSAPLGMPYSGAMFVITLDEVGEPKQKWEGWWHEPYRLGEDDFATLDEYIAYLQSVKTTVLPAGYSVKLTGTVTEVVSLQESYRDSTGWTARLTLNVHTLEELEALNLVPGEQYVIYGTDYVDEWWRLVGDLTARDYDHLHLDPFDPALLKVFTEEEIQANVDRGFGSYPASYNWIMLSQWQYEMVNAFTMTLETPLALSEFVEIRDEEGYLENVFEKTEFTISDPNGKTVTLSKEEYIDRYRHPTIAHLEGSLEEFLNSDQGSLWKTTLEQAEVNHHAFAVVGVDKLDYLANFSLKYAQITDGREFTEEELNNGARVCIIHQKLALNAGLQLGDTVTMSFYGTDHALPYVTEVAPLNPTASFYFGTTPITETAEYTIVGFYSGENWPNVHEDPYAMSANCVFVPLSSVLTPMEESDTIVFNTVALQNGQVDAFQELTVRFGYGGRFKYDDQGYASIAANFHNYEALGKQVLQIGGIMYFVLLLLFLLLYPVSQRKNIRTMQSFGAGYLRRFGHILSSSAAIMIPASLLGGVIGIQLWDRMVLSLQTTAESAVALQIEPEILGIIAALQLGFALVLNILVALLVAAPRGISSRD